MLRIFEAHFREKIKNTEAQTKIHHSYKEKKRVFYIRENDMKSE